jgi:GNAT superfamily N-acetyltransferase
MPSCRLTVLIERATAAVATAIASLRNDAADHLTHQYGRNYGSGHCSERGVVADMKRGAVVYVARAKNGLLGTMTIATRKPWAIDPAYFAGSQRPLYLTNMAVAPAHQRTGVGRALLAEARRIAAAWPADAIRLDAFDTVSGAGEFYAKCGFREVGRKAYRAVPLIYYELVL